MKLTLHPRRRMIVLLLISLALCFVAFGEGDEVAISPRYGVIRETGGVATTSPFIPHEYSGSVGTSLAVASEPCVGDFDGDGYADYCLPQYLDGYGDEGDTVDAKFLAIVGFGDGQGGIDDTKGESGYREIDGAFPEVLDCGDLDEDGCDDIISVVYSDQNDETFVNSSRHYSVWFGSKDNTFRRTNMLGNNVSHYSLKLVDLNADSHLDVLSIVLTEDGEVQIWLLLGGGDGQFSEPIVSVLADVAFAQKQTIRVGDVNGDAVPDVILATINPADQGLYRLVVGYGNRAGEYTFNIGETLRFIPRLVAVGDINGDGSDDACVVHWLDLIINEEMPGSQYAPTLSTQVSVFFGVPGEVLRFSESHDLGVSAIFSFMEDLDEDGYADAEFITDQGICLVLPGSQNGLQGPPMAYSAANGSHSQCILGGLEDLNADGKLDLYVQLYEQELVVRFGNEDGGFGTGWMAPPTTTDLPIYATALAGPSDFDKDGQLDLVFLKGAGAGIAYGNNLGGFDEMTVLVDEFGWSSSAIGDFNGDGLSDVLLGQEFATWDNKLCLFLNEGHRRFSRIDKFLPTLVAAPSETSYGEDVIELLSGDLNEDGIDDVVVCESDETYILLGDIESGLIRGESLTLSPERITPANKRQAGISLFTPVLLDINADGHLDLVGVDISSVPNRTLVWLGDGTGEFTDVAEYPYRHLFGWPSDTNSDGYDDILAWHIESGYHVLLGGPDGLLHPEAIEVEPWMGVGANLIGDLNGDGQADFAEAWGMVLWIYLGEGRGDRGERLQFAPHAEGKFSYDVTTIAGDFNGDGRPDIALPSHYQISIILNRFPEKGDRE